jgi:hypothetical protein
MAGKSKVLKPIQLQAIHLLLSKGERAGAVKETAAQIGLKRPETLWRWRQSPLFAQEYQRQKAVYEASLADEPLASKRRRIQLLTAEIDALQAKREESASLGEAAAASRAIGNHLKQISDEMAPIVAATETEGGISFTQNNLSLTLSTMSMAELKAAKKAITDPSMEPLARILIPVLQGGSVPP